MNVLNLPDWKVTAVDNRADETVVTAAYEKHPSTCHKCGAVGNLLNGVLLKFGSTKLSVADLPAYGKRTTILVTRQRYRCRDCKATFVQPLPDLDDKSTMTRRLVAYIERESLRKTFVDIAEQVGITEGTVRNVFHAYVKRLEKVVTFKTPRVLGIDELFLVGDPRCILTDIEHRTIVGLLAKRNLEPVYRHLLSMPDRERVEVVTMDMWNPYRTAVRAAFPKAVIVADKKHVLNFADNALERVRRQLRSSVSNKMGRELMRSRFILRRRASRLDEKNLLLRDVWLQQFPTLRDAYWLKEGFYDLYDAKTETEARTLYAAWLDRLTVEMRLEFKDLTTMMDNWEQEVFAFFTHRYTNAYTEALNGIVKIAYRTGRGYSFEVIRSKMLYVDSVHRVDALNERAELVAFERLEEQTFSLGADLFNAVMVSFKERFPGKELVIDNLESYLHPGGLTTLAEQISELIESAESTPDYE